MLATLITTHVNDAIARLLYQYKDSDRLKYILTAFSEQIQELEQAIFDLDAGRQIYNAEGEQLDLLGEIVGIERNGLEDDQYRLFILGKIGENFTDASIGRTAAVYAVLLGSDIVQEQDLYPAGAGYAAGGTLDDSLVSIVWMMVQRSLGAAIRLEFLELFDEEQGFAFDGPAGTGLGFGDATDAGAGGTFAYLLDPNFEFAFNGDDPNDGGYGFGTLEDPLTGGEFQSA